MGFKCGGGSEWQWVAVGGSNIGHEKFLGKNKNFLKEFLEFLLLPLTATHCHSLPLLWRTNETY